MVTIGGADRVLAQVRAQLERMARARRTGAAGRSEHAGPASGARGSGRLAAAASLTGLADDELNKAMVGAMLSEEFGEDVAGDPRFQEVVDRTVATLRDDPAMASALATLRAQLVDRRRSDV